MTDRIHQRPSWRKTECGWRLTGNWVACSLTPGVAGHFSVSFHLFSCFTYRMGYLKAVSTDC